MRKKHVISHTLHWMITIYVCYVMLLIVGYITDGLFYEVIKQIILCFIEIEYQADCDNSAFQIIGTFSKYDVVHFLQREICADQESFDRVISLLFDGIDFDKFSRETIELYLDVFCSFVSRYFDAYQDNKLRELIEKKIKILETNILAINNPSVRIGLTAGSSYD